MALKEIDKNNPPQGLDGILLHLNNGDLNAVKVAKEKWRFKKLEDVIRYALAVIAQSENAIVYVTHNGQKIPLTPSEELLEPQLPEIQEQVLDVESSNP